MFVTNLRSLIFILLASSEVFTFPHKLTIV